MVSPAAEKPWARRRTTRSTGARTPTRAYVGSRPIPVVAHPIMRITKASTRLRPIRSPRLPSRNAPTGRITNPTAYTANVESRATNVFAWGKKRVAMTGAA